MEFGTLFIKRPIMTTLAMISMVIFGLISWRLLPVSDLPNVDFPTIQVTATLPGANPDTMASAVATPLERQFSAIAGLSSMTSSSALGQTNITLQFELSRNIDAAAQDVQAAMTAAAAYLPPMPTPPTYQKVNPADQPIIYLTLSSASQPLYTVDKYAEELVGQRLSMVDGVAQVEVFGSQVYAVHAQIDPDLLAARGIGIDDVKNAIVNGNVNLPTGTLYGRETAFMLQANGQLLNAKQYAPLVVAYKNGAPVRLQDLGRVIDSVENDKVASWYNGQRAVVLAILRQPGTNTVKIVDQIKQVLPGLLAQIPGSVKLGILYDRSSTIRQSVSDVEGTLLITMFLVVAVIFLFLRNIPATAIPSLALPTSILGTFAVIYLLGFSLDNLSLMALTLSVGFVVDDAIVVLENIVRHMELGEPRLDAAINGLSEIRFTVISMTLSLVAVFIPILFMGGIIGRLFNEFAVTSAIAILISAFVSLTFTPMLCSRWLRPEEMHADTGFFAVLENGWTWLSDRYESTLRQSLDHRFMVLMGLIALTALTAVLFVISPKSFMPDEDTGQITGVTQAAQSISFDSMVRHQQALAKIAMADPSVAGVMSSVGAGGSTPTANNGRLFLSLKPFGQRSLKAQQIIANLRPKMAAVPGIRVYLQIPPTIKIGGQVSTSLYQAALMSSDTDHLYHSAALMYQKMQNLPALTDVATDVMNNSPQVNVTVDRQLAAAMGVTENQVEEALADAYGMRQISTIYAPTNEYRVILEVEPEYQRSPKALSKIYIHSSNGGMVPVSAVAKLTTGIGPLVVNHLGQFPSATLSFNLAPGYSLGEALDEINRLGKDVVDSDVTLSFQGQAQAFQSSMQDLGWLLVLAVFIIYVILGMLYESFIHPLTILSGLPTAGLGALITLMLFHKDLDIYGFLGLIMLIGIVKKNAIMMIDFAVEAERNEGLSPDEAIYKACLTRFRPIMMTSLAALMGSLPIALGLGAGGESRQPLGLAVVGGLLVSQALTLYVTPVVYVYLDAVQQRLRRKREAPGTSPAAA